MHEMVQGLVKVWGLPVRPNDPTKEELLEMENF